MPSIHFAVVRSTQASIFATILLLFSGAGPNSPYFFLPTISITILPVSYLEHVRPPLGATFRLGIQATHTLFEPKARASDHLLYSNCRKSRAISTAVLLRCSDRLRFILIASIKYRRNPRLLAEAGWLLSMRPLDIQNCQFRVRGPQPMQALNILRQIEFSFLA